MNIGELFINLGIKGADKTSQGLKQVKNDVGDLVSSSIAAKAAILAAMYALEKMTAQSGSAGTSLVNYAALTGNSLVELQKWQFGMQQAGMTSEQTAEGFKNLFDVMGKISAGKPLPEGFSRISSAVGMDQKRLGDTKYVMEKLRDYAIMTDSLTGNLRSRANQDLDSMGFGAFTAAARRHKLDRKVLDHADTYSPNEAKRLSSVYAGWQRIGSEIEHTIGHLNAKFGPQLLPQIEHVTVAVLHLITVLAELADKFGVFKVVGGTLGFAATMADDYGKAGDQLLKGGVDEKGNSGLEKLFAASFLGRSIGLGSMITKKVISVVQNNHISGVPAKDISHHSEKKLTEAVYRVSQDGRAN